MKGIYVLLIAVRHNLILEIGALGPTAFGRGLYAYVGSAQISLKKRVERHLRKSKRKFWHVDYLIAKDAVKVVKVLWKEGERKQECETARMIGQFGTAVKGFGSSDCNCKSHLFKVDNPDFLRQNMHEIRIDLV